MSIEPPDDAAADALLREVMAVAQAAPGSIADRLAVALEAAAAATGDGALRHAARIAGGRRSAGRHPMCDERDSGDLAEALGMVASGKARTLHAALRVVARKYSRDTREIHVIVERLRRRARREKKFPPKSISGTRRGGMS